MLVNGVRFCDVCNSAIAVGEHFVSSTIPKDRAELFMSLISKIEDDPPEPSSNPDGTVTLTICIECKLNMGGQTNDFVH